MTSRCTHLKQRLLQTVGIWSWALVLFCGAAIVAQAQATKLDEFENIRTSDAKAHLDIFAKRLSDEPDSNGSLVVYFPENWPPGSFLRSVYGCVDYLVNMRGILRNRLAVITRGPKRNVFVELWLIPRGSSSPAQSTGNTLQLAQLTEFDSLYFGSGCESEYTLTLEDPSDAIRFFTFALQENPSMEGLVILHPKGAPNHRESRIVFASSIAKLKNEQSISPDRISTSISDPRYCGELEFWLVPPDFVVPKEQSAKSYLQSRLIAEAVEKRYTIGIVYFQGIRYTRDSLLRKAMPGLTEGEIFTTAVLQKSLNDVSRLSVIEPIRLGDVDIHLNRAQSTLDLTLSFRERSHSRR